ncbi:MAG: hypothetical protein ABFD82_06960 [Syntrophaceae bacterium]
MNNTELTMKKYFLFLLVGIFLLISHQSFAGGSIPNLVGKWHGKATMCGKLHGFESLQNITFIIVEQKGRFVKGRKEWNARGKEYAEGFSGLISMDNKQLYIAEYEGGICIGEIISREQIILYYLKDGRGASVAIYELMRLK